MPTLNLASISVPNDIVLVFYLDKYKEKQNPWYAGRVEQLLSIAPAKYSVLFDDGPAPDVIMLTEKDYQGVDKTKEIWYFLRKAGR